MRESHAHNMEVISSLNNQLEENRDVLHHRDASIRHLESSLHNATQQLNQSQRNEVCILILILSL